MTTPAVPVNAIPTEKATAITQLGLIPNRVAAFMFSDAALTASQTRLLEEYEDHGSSRQGDHQSMSVRRNVICEANVKLE